MSWHPNLSVITRVCASSSDPNDSTVVREVCYTDSSFKDNDCYLLGVHQSWPSVMSSFCKDPAHKQFPVRSSLGSHSRRQDSNTDEAVMCSQYRQRSIPYGHTSPNGEGWTDMIRGGNARRRRAIDAVKGGCQLFKISIPYGQHYSKRWLLTSLQNLCPVAFIPLHYSTRMNEAHFYLDDAAAASSLRKLTGRITDKEGRRVVVLVSICSRPPFFQRELKSQDLGLLKHCLSSRFDSSQKSLDLTSIFTDPVLVARNINMMLNKRHCMQAVIEIIRENFPELLSLNLSNNMLYKLDDFAELVKITHNLKSLNLSHNKLRSEQELEKVKGFRLVELWLDRNPLCDHFNDQTTYISAVRERFPMLLKLDGHVLPTPIGFDVETCTSIPTCKGSRFVSNEIQDLIQRFLQDYYHVYDSRERQPLLEAYHDNAIFSLSLPSHFISLRNKYLEHNRNIKNINVSSARFRLLKHSRLTVVAFLNELPPTQHYAQSFTVDVNMFSKTLLVFTVSGLFREYESSDLRHSIKAFSRVFLTVPAQNSGLCIINDELFVRNAKSEEIRCAFASSVPSPEPSSALVPILSAAQNQMLVAFSQNSDMNLEWSQKCLQDNGWDFNKAADIFTKLKAQGKIPEAAFIK